MELAVRGEMGNMGKNGEKGDNGELTWCYIVT